MGEVLTRKNGVGIVIQIRRFKYKLAQKLNIYVVLGEQFNT